MNFSAVKSVWINNTPSHIHQCEIGSYAPGYKKVAKKYEEKKNNGSEWNRKYDVFSWFWWLTIHIGKTPAKASHHIDPR